MTASLTTQSHVELRIMNGYTIRKHTLSYITFMQLELRIHSPTEGKTSQQVGVISEILRRRYSPRHVAQSSVCLCTCVRACQNESLNRSPFVRIKVMLKHITPSVLHSYHNLVQTGATSALCAHSCCCNTRNNLLDLPLKQATSTPYVFFNVFYKEANLLPKTSHCK